MSDEASFSFGMDGLGNVTISGTNEFVQEAIKHTAPLVDLTLQRWIDKRQAEGLTFDEAEAEFMKSFDEAVANMTTVGDDKKNVTMELAR